MGEEPAQLRREIDETRSDLTRDVDLLVEKTSPSRVVGRRVERARSGLRGVKETVMGTTSHGGSDRGSRTGSPTAPGITHRVGEAASSATDSASDAAGSAVDTVRRQTEGNPLAAGVIAFGVGWLVSSLLPASAAETQAAGRLTEAAQEHGGPVVQRAKEAASEVGEDLREPAREAAASVTDTAKEGASAVRDQGRASATEVRDQAGARG